MSTNFNYFCFAIFVFFEIQELKRENLQSVWHSKTNFLKMLSRKQSTIGTRLSFEICIIPNQTAFTDINSGGLFQKRGLLKRRVFLLHHCVN